MATEAGLRFFLSADMKDFERAMKDAQTLSKQTADGIVKAGVKIAGTGDYVADLNRDLRSLITSMKDGGTRFVAFGSNVDKAGNITRNFTNKAGNASTALMGLTRIAQDAPFGFIAIGNNIAETVSQLGSLVKTSGGAGNALKALGSSLIGPGGVVLGLNLLITGLTVAVQKYGSLGGAIDALINPLTEQAKLQKEVNDAIAEGQKEIQNEIVNARRLFIVASSVTQSMSVRKEAIKELRKQYPAYLKDFNDEQLLAGQASAAYNKLNASLLGIAKSRALSSKAAKNEGEILDLNEKRRLAQLKLDVLEEKANKRAADLTKRTGKQFVAGLGGPEFRKVRDELAEIDERLALLTSQNIVLDKEAAAVTDDLTNKIEQRAAAEAEAARKRAEAAARNKKTIYEEIKGISELNEVLNSGRRQDVFFKEQSIPLLQPLDTSLIPGMAEKYAQTLASNLQFQWSKTVIPAVEISAKELNRITEFYLEKGIVDISTGIGNALAGGGLSGVISGFVNMIAGFMQELGSLLIAEGVSLEAFKNSLKTGQGIPAIIAGAALVAASSAFRAFADKGPSSFATGGTVYGDQIARVGDNAAQKEHILSDMQLRKIAEGAGIGSGGDVIAETKIDGTQLAILLRRAGYQISRING